MKFGITNKRHRNYEVDEYGRPDSYSTDVNQYGPQAEMPPWFQAFFARYVRQREELKRAISMVAERSMPVAALAAPQMQYREPIQPVARVNNNKLSADPDIDDATFRKMNLNITLLEGGILFHSVFVGMTVSITTDGFIILLIAILFHQFFEGLGLGSRIAAVPYPKGAAKPWVLVCAFGTTAPIGQAIGLITRNSYDPSSAFALIIVGVFNAISSGLLIFAATVDLLAEDFLSEEAQHILTKKMKIQAFTYILLGGKSLLLYPNLYIVLTKVDSRWYVDCRCFRVDEKHQHFPYGTQTLFAHLIPTRSSYHFDPFKIPHKSSPPI